MEAPEIIYRTTTYLDSDRGKTVWKSHPVAGAENVEYIRKDVFIKKTEKWFKSHGSFTIGFDGATVRDFLKFINE